MLRARARATARVRSGSLGGLTFSTRLVRPLFIFTTMKEIFEMIIAYSRYLVIKVVVEFGIE